MGKTIKDVGCKDTGLFRGNSLPVQGTRARVVDGENEKNRDQKEAGSNSVASVSKVGGRRPSGMHRSVRK